MAGASDMSNGNGNGNGFDPMAQYARLSERVENQGKDIVDLRSNMNTGFSTVNSAIGTLSNELRNNSKTQWPVIWAAAGVCFTVLITVGTFFYSTLSKGQDRLDAAIASSAQVSQTSISKLADATQVAMTAITDKMVTQKELEWRTARSAEDRARTDAAVADLRSNQVPRQELERVWQSDDQQKAQLQKQIDELKQNQASTYSARDVILDMRERLDRIERMRVAPGG